MTRLLIAGAPWPGGAPADDGQAGKPRPSRMLDTLLEVMDLAQLDSSEQHAARADVPIRSSCYCRMSHAA